MNKKEKRAIFIGSASLLEECIKAWLESGFRVDAVISEDETIISFCQKNNLTCYAGFHDYPHKTDYIFSIVNEKILPASFINQAYCCAINYHPGPLPRYAGMNGWSWAIFNNDNSYGATWHVMEEGIDEGDIVEQNLFEIDSSISSQELLLKCSMEGLSGFYRLLQSIRDDSVVFYPQDFSNRTVYKLNDVIPYVGYINFRQTVDKIGALLR